MVVEKRGQRKKSVWSQRSKRKEKIVSVNNSKWFFFSEKWKKIPLGILLGHYNDIKFIVSFKKCDTNEKIYSL